LASGFAEWNKERTSLLTSLHDEVINSDDISFSGIDSEDSYSKLSTSVNYSTSRFIKFFKNLKLLKKKFDILVSRMENLFEGVFDKCLEGLLFFYCFVFI
jgi:hypothetical protein